MRLAGGFFEWYFRTVAAVKMVKSGYMPKIFWQKTGLPELLLTLPKPLHNLKTQATR